MAPPSSTPLLAGGGQRAPATRLGAQASTLQLVAQYTGTSRALPKTVRWYRVGPLRIGFFIVASPARRISKRTIVLVCLLLYGATFGWLPWTNGTLIESAQQPGG